MGSSGIKMIVTDRRGRTVLDEKIGAQLGQRIGSDRLLPRTNQRRAVSALATLVRRAAGYGVLPSEIEVITTAAVRNANGKVTAAARAKGKASGTQFVEKVRGQLGLERTRILSGEEEAQLGYRGALASIGDAKRRYLVIDTGGGSHQLVVGIGGAIEQAGSAQVGSNFVAEKILVDSRNRPLEVLSADDLATADKRMARAVSNLPIDSARAQGAIPVLTGGTGKYLRYYFRKDTITREEIESLRAEVSALKRSPRAKLVRKDANGRKFNRREETLLGLDEGGGADAYGMKLPAKLTLVLRLMTLLRVDSVQLSQTDARHALLGAGAAAR